MDPRILEIYQDNPMADGDVVVQLCDQKVATEIEGLADAWDPVLRRNLTRVLRDLDLTEVEIGIARRGARLKPGDLQLVDELREDLEGAGIAVLPVIALPAA